MLWKKGDIEIRIDDNNGRVWIYIVGVKKTVVGVIEFVNEIRVVE